jgi:hypothetical protein
VVMIRHGEKGADSNPHLSDAGWKRAACLPRIFAANSTGFGGAITHIFAQRPTAGVPSNRSVETVTPLSAALGVEIDTRFSRDEVGPLARAIRELPATTVVLVCWEHATLTDVLNLLGMSDPPLMHGFSTIWQWSGGKLSVSSEAPIC